MTVEWSLGSSISVAVMWSGAQSVGDNGSPADIRTTIPQRLDGQESFLGKLNVVPLAGIVVVSLLRVFIPDLSGAPRMILVQLRI
jgi:hypothetical protein